MADEAVPTIEMLFATPLIRLRFGTPEFIAALADSIRARREASKGIQRSNFGGWHSDTEMVKWGGAPARDLALKTLETCARFTADASLLRGAQPRYEFGIEMWANISPMGASNQMHAHPGSLWSAVYFVDNGGDADPTSADPTADGALVLLDPRFPMNRAHAADLVFVGPDGAREESNVKIVPEPGTMLIFPSWLMHGVRPHGGRGERISIAMNVIAMPARRTPA